MNKTKMNIKTISRSVGSMLFGVVLLVAALVPPQKASAAIFSTNLPAANGFYVVLTNGPYKISQVQVLAGAAPVLLDVFDDIHGTNYTNSAYIGVSTYSTNIVTTYISPISGVTNLITNYGTFTYTNTVAASTTNALPYQTFPAQASTLATYPTSLLNVKGITIRANTNCSVVLTYTPY